MVTHIVLFRLSPDAPEGTATEVANRLRAMDGKVPQLVSIEVGINEIPSERASDVSLITRFASMDDLKAYAVHPAHQEVVTFIKQWAVESRVVDYSA